MNARRRILIAGQPVAGSWTIRAEQLGPAIGATVQADPDDETLARHDLVVVVKRAQPTLLPRLHAMNKPVVWDVVDPWPQPQGAHWDRDNCMVLLRQGLADFRPCGVVAATQKMADDIGPGYPVIALPHHCRPVLERNPIRPEIKALVYEGNRRYLGTWERHLQQQCERRGWTLRINPPALADGDVVVVFRAYEGYASRHWKSAVKLANAQGSGTPVVLNRESGYIETASGGEIWCDDPDQLSDCLDALLDVRERQRRATLLWAARPTIDAIALRYRVWLDALDLNFRGPSTLSVGSLRAYGPPASLQITEAIAWLSSQAVAPATTRIERDYAPGTLSVGNAASDVIDRNQMRLAQICNDGYRALDLGPDARRISELSRVVADSAQIDTWLGKAQADRRSYWEVAAYTMLAYVHAALSDKRAAKACFQRVVDVRNTPRDPLTVVDQMTALYAMGYVGCINRNYAGAYHWWGCAIAFCRDQIVHGSDAVTGSRLIDLASHAAAGLARIAALYLPDHSHLPLLRPDLVPSGAPWRWLAPLLAIPHRLP